MVMIIGEGGPPDKASIALSTSKNRPIPNKQMPELAPETAFAAKRIYGKGSWQLRSQRSTYNCVGLVFANRRTFIEPDEIPMILQDDEYIEVARDTDVMPGDVVIYKTPRRTISFMSAWCLRPKAFSRREKYASLASSAGSVNIFTTCGTCRSPMGSRF